MTNGPGPSGARRPTTVREAVAFVIRHAVGAPFPHFGDTRSRTAYIRLRVSRRPRAELEYTLRLAAALCRHAGTALTREERGAVYAVTHEIRAEIARAADAAAATEGTE
ncbi:hypothetical protein ACWD3I_25125 [Streptomyces sp. NPDC002817]|uniref:hypothetical protein n=1 Tax=Streptomyces sp. NPDC088357 TaxID=3154655 RepID=UPI00341BDB50